ncbi:MAG: hypothetical protein JWO19_4929 [Bryobacterales bacterium]|nr:hypothetical protein [Bryobacterales bacterium]
MIQRIVFIALSAGIVSYGQGFNTDQPRVADAPVVREQDPDPMLEKARERHFVDRANRVAALWTKLSKEYNERHAFNIKLAREISKAFRDLENDENWPKDRSK